MACLIDKGVPMPIPAIPYGDNAVVQAGFQAAEDVAAYRAEPGVKLRFPDSRVIGAGHEQMNMRIDQPGQKRTAGKIQPIAVPLFRNSLQNTDCRIALNCRC